MTQSPLTTLLLLLDDVSRDLPQAERHQRLLQALQNLPCDALALLRREGDTLVPVTVFELNADAQGSDLRLENITPTARIEQELPCCGLREAVDRYQRQLIEALLQRHQGNLSATARALKIDRGNLHRLSRRLGLTHRGLPESEGSVSEQ